MIGLFLRIEPEVLALAWAVPCVAIVLFVRWAFSGPNPGIKDCAECGQMFHGEGIYCEPCCQDLTNWHRATMSDFMREGK